MILAIPAALSEIPPKPKIPEITAITRKIKTHRSIVVLYWLGV